MSEPEITLVLTPSLLTQPLVSGEVKPTGMNLRVEVAKNIDETSRRLPKRDYDVIEADIATYVRAHEDRIPVIGLPVFASGRRFVHRGMLWSQRAAIRDLHDLPGRSAVTPQYWLASSIWQRKLLGMVYRVEPEGVSWVTLQPERLENLNVPSGLMHRLETVGRSAEALARTGSADILLLPETTGPAFVPRTRGAPSAFVPAFPNVREAQKQFFEQFGIFPILNTMVIREQLVQEQPWVVDSLCEAFAEAKLIAQRREQLGTADEPGPGETTTWMRDLLGEDAWAYGLGANRKTLNAFLAASRNQDLLVHRFELEELFCSELPDKF